MRLVYLFSFCLALGVLVSQIFDLTPYEDVLLFLTSLFLSYILMEVGLEFVIYKEKWKNYLFDYVVAFTAATLPWLFCFGYFLYIGSSSWEETLLIARFAAPTSSGILFTMLAAAGLATSWLFRKVQILAILDDVDTILLMVPIQFLLIGVRMELIFVIFFVILILILGYRYLHRLKWPAGRLWILTYSFILVFLLEVIYRKFDIEIEPLLPAFIFGCLLYNRHDPRQIKKHTHEHQFLEPEERPLVHLDRTIKVIFMCLVGLIMPKVNFENLDLYRLAFDVLIITFVSNLGKCAPLLFYRTESKVHERMAVCWSMFIRGEVGAGILALAVEHGVTGYITTVAILSLIVNLLLTGLFISQAVKLVRPART